MTWVGETFLLEAGWTTAGNNRRFTSLLQLMSIDFILHSRCAEVITPGFTGDCCSKALHDLIQKDL